MFIITLSASQVTCNKFTCKLITYINLLLFIIIHIIHQSFNIIIELKLKSLCVNH